MREQGGGGGGGGRGRNRGGGSRDGEESRSHTHLCTKDFSLRTVHLSLELPASYLPQCHELSLQPFTLVLQTLCYLPVLVCLCLERCVCVCVWGGGGGGGISNDQSRVLAKCVSMHISKHLNSWLYCSCVSLAVGCGNTSLVPTIFSSVQPKTVWAWE